MNTQNHYATLSIDRCASCEEIKRAYRLLARRFHPDVSDDRDGERKFKDVSEAYRTLKLPASRVAYDRQIRNVCGSAGAVRVAALQDMAAGDYGLALWRYWLWFWPIGSDRN